jgi:DNA-binding Xre family transcriptional regulator
MTIAYKSGERVKKLDKIYLTLKEKLEESGITRYQLSKMTDIQYHTIDKYSKNKVVKYDSYILERFCRALKCPVSDLIHVSQEDNE